MWIPYGEVPVSHKSSDTKFVFQKMPPDLSADLFSAWYDRISNIAKNIGLFDPVRSDVIVVFSDKEKKCVFGSLSVEEAKNKIRKRWNLGERADNLLNELRVPEDFYGSQMISTLAEDICASNRERGENYESVRSGLKEIFEMVAFEQLVLGEYIYPEIIILYTKNIEQTQRAKGEKRTLAEVYEEVFAHEMFHAYHYQDKTEELIERMDYTSRVVKESLAAAFEWKYCVEYKIPNADALRYEWGTYPVTTYPYSGAGNLLKPVPHKAMVCLDEAAFCDVFYRSQVDMDRALRMLVPNEFYNIKNLVHYREIKVMSTDLRAAFDTLMKQDAISVIAQREISSIIRQKKNRRLIPQLMDLVYSNEHFHATQYPILATSPMIDPAGRVKSYADPVLRIGKKNFPVENLLNFKA